MAVGAVLNRITRTIPGNIQLRYLEIIETRPADSAQAYRRRFAARDHGIALHLQVAQTDPSLLLWAAPLRFGRRMHLLSATMACPCSLKHAIQYITASIRPQARLQPNAPMSILRTSGRPAPPMLNANDSGGPAFSAFDHSVFDLLFQAKPRHRKDAKHQHHQC
jgi:hypothetical protein